MATVASGTLTGGGAASTATVTAGSGILVTNLSQTGVIWVKVGGTATVAGSDCYPVTGTRVLDYHGASIAVSLISSASLLYSVEGLPA